jgi:hypothetical protein
MDWIGVKNTAKSVADCREQANEYEKFDHPGVD